MVGGT